MAAVAVSVLLLGSFVVLQGGLGVGVLSGGDAVTVPSPSSRATTGTRVEPAPGMVECEVRDECVAWSLQASSPEESFGTPAIFGRRVFVGLGATLVALDAISGTESWRSDLDAELSVAPAAGDELVAAVDDGGRIYAFEQGDGTLRWSVSTGTARPADVEVTGSRVVASLRRSDGSGLLVALRLEDGSEAWSRPLEGHPSPLVVAPLPGGSSRVFVAARDTTWGLEPQNGQVVWAAHGVGRPHSFIERHGLLLSLDSEGMLALHSEDGAISWSAPEVRGVLPAYVARWDQLFFTIGAVAGQGPGSGDIFLNVFDAADGSGVDRAPIRHPSATAGSMPPQVVAADMHGWLYVSTGNSVLTVHPRTGEATSVLKLPHDAPPAVAEVVGGELAFTALPISTGRVLYGVEIAPDGQTPMILEALEQGDGCPTSPREDRPYGEVLASQGVSDEDRFEMSIDGLTERALSRWTTVYDPGSLADQVLVRGSALDGGARLGLRMSTEEAFTERLVLAGQGRRLSADMPAHWVFDIDFPSSGCWGIQLDTLTDTHTFVLEVPDRLAEMDGT